MDDKEKKPGNPWTKSLLIWVGIIFALVLCVQVIGGGRRSTAGQAMAYSDFVKQVDGGNVRSATMATGTTGNSAITGKLGGGEDFHTVAPVGANIADKMIAKGVAVQVKAEETSSIWVYMLYNSLPLLLIFGVGLFIIRQMHKNAGSAAIGFGASRVRVMFDQAKKSAPCIVFIDEIDAVGRHRGAGLGTGNEDREQTLNQLLVEMDGFEANEGIIIIAAPNRPDVLDPALLRPGRFDRQVVVPRPDIDGREQILGVHMKKVPLAPDVDPRVIARGTPGFSGADLANLVNEAALLAARRGKRLVAMKEFEEAKDKVMMGTERKSMVMTEDEKRMTAYHEAGHAIVALHEPASDPIHKATIIPRGRALGMGMRLPERYNYSYYRDKKFASLAVSMGGGGS